MRMISLQILSLGPIVERGNSAKPDLGYHYDALDYIFTGVTVNNCRLTIKPGTAIGVNFAAADFGILLTAGGRLFCEGLPTNRITFVRTHAVQETVNPLWEGWYPTITENPANAPLPEARFRFCDFPMLSGSYYHYYPGLYWDWWQDFPPLNARMGVLAFTDCQLVGGYFSYDEAATAQRTLAITNCLLHRVNTLISDFEPLNGVTHLNFQAWNNLFYGGYLDINPVTGNTWQIKDNIFDQVDLTPDAKSTPNANPINGQDHNAYVAMTERWLPSRSTTTDPNLTSLTYASGTLGDYYLPATSPLLIDKGSRSRAAAGLFHYTSLSAQTKEGSESSANVNIGLHYVALLTAKPVDTDNDGVPDYAEDYSGDGSVGADETSWSVTESEPVKFVGLVNGGSLAQGRVRIKVWVKDLMPNTGSRVGYVSLTSDGYPIPGCGGLTPAFTLPLCFEVDTMRLPNGTHSLKLEVARYYAAAGYFSGLPLAVYSEPVLVTVYNPLVFSVTSELAARKEVFRLASALQMRLPRGHCQSTITPRSSSPPPRGRGPQWN